MTESGYLRRRRSRERLAALRRRILFGYVMGGVLMSVAGVFLLFVAPARDWLWRCVFWTGAALGGCALVVPDVLHWPERAWMGAAQVLGKVVFTGVLTLTYFSVIMPLGLLRRLFSGTAPFAWWESAPPTDAEGWTEKRIPVGTTRRAGRRRGILRQAFGVLLFMVRRRQWLLVPALILLVVLGMALFFIQSSVLAPLIYTVF